MRLRIGNRGPFHFTSAGNNILVSLREEELENILKKSKIIPFADKTITSIENLRNELRTVRDWGFHFVIGNMTSTSEQSVHPSSARGQRSWGQSLLSLRIDVSK